MQKLKKLVALLAVTAGIVSGGGLVASAGLEDPAPSTVGYTIYFPPLNGADALPDGSLEDLGDVSALQGDCIAQLATVDLTTGVVAPLPAAPTDTACAGDLAFAPDGTLYGLVQGSEGNALFAELVTYDLTSGAATLVGRFGPFQNSLGGASELPFGGLTFDATGTLYALLGHPRSPGFDQQCAPDTTEFINWCLYRVDDPSTPEASTFVGVSATDAAFASVLAASCDAVYTSTFNVKSESSVVATVNTDTAALTDIGALDAPRFLEGADFDAAGTFWGLVLSAVVESGFVLNVATLNPAGGTPIETLGPEVAPPDEDFFMEALAVEPLDCTPPEPVVLQPTFTG